MSPRRHTVIAREGAEPKPKSEPRLDRREAMRLLTLGAAAAVASCTHPRGAIVPWVDQPEDAAQGRREVFATSLPLSGYGRGAVAFVQDGRPIKIEGNPRHPFSLGATDVFMEGAVLDLFDPQRQALVRGPSGPSTEEAADAALITALARERATGGAGLRILTARDCSPTFLRRLAALQARFPAAQVHRWEPAHDDAARVGARMAFGRPLTALPRLQNADVIVVLDADPLGPGPDQLRLARGFAARRNPRTGPVSRLYVLEPGMTATGAMADRRAPLPSALVRNAALEIAASLGASGPDGGLPDPAQRLLRDAVADLSRAHGRAIVLVGAAQPPEVHALAHWINARLGAPVDLYEPVDPWAEDNAAGLQALARDLHARRVSSLVVIGANPAYDAPPALELNEAISRVPFSLHAGLYDDETAALCRWRVPLAHPLESWSDARALDGTASLIQPMIAPLWGGRPAHALVGVMAEDGEADPAHAVAQTWADRAGADADGWRRTVLAAGVIEGTAAKPVAAPEPRLPAVAPAAQAAQGLEIRLQPSACVWDGRYAPNAWLQECPDPLTKEVWGASFRIARADAQRLGLNDGDRLRLARGASNVEASVRIVSGQATGTATLLLGYGRQRVGPIADGIGPNAYLLRTNAAEFALTGVQVTRGEGRRTTPETQHHYVLDDADLEKLFPVVPPGGRPADPRVEPQPTLLPAREGHPPAFAMVIDNAVCIGCNACVVACQAENNIPVIGPDEIEHERDMHWLRIDRFDVSQDDQDPQPGFQPTPCMHCEHAPCEPVCPVEASVHDQHGLNLQVYNRCIGTRFCEANCPYKVRRFNFRDYQDQQHLYGGLNALPLTAQRNPEVTVRARGVMEKCTYCLQRIRASRTVWGDKPPVTACQAACPTRAIAFGDLSDPGSEVAQLQSDPRRYALLGHLGTRPRTTYLARVRNTPDDGSSPA